MASHSVRRPNVSKVSNFVSLKHSGPMPKLTCRCVIFNRFESTPMIKGLLGWLATGFVSWQNFQYVTTNIFRHPSSRNWAFTLFFLCQKKTSPNNSMWQVLLQLWILNLHCPEHSFTFLLWNEEVALQTSRPEQALALITGRISSRAGPAWQDLLTFEEMPQWLMAGFLFKFKESPVWLGKRRPPWAWTLQWEL